MAALTPITISRAGVNLALAAAAAGGDTFANDGATFFAVKNAGSGSVTVTFTVTATYIGLTVSNVAVAVTNDSNTYLIGPFPQAAFNSASGTVAVAYSGVTSVTVAAVKLPSA